MLSRYYSARTNDRYVTLILTFAGIVGAAMILFATVIPAQAQSWSVQSQGGCHGNPEGASWISWNGYRSSTEGESYGSLWYWTDGSWVRMNQTYASSSGSSNSAVANTSNQFMAGNWNQTGQHRLDFFSEWVGSESGIFTC